MQLYEDAELSQYLFTEVCDLDLSSLYPSIICALNLAPETLVCKINIKRLNEDTMIYENEEDVLIDKYISKDYIAVGSEYLNLPTINELILAVEEAS